MSVINYADVKKEKLVGEGGFASVYKATWQGQTVALKEWKPEIAMNPDQMTLFQREVQVNRLCDHPNVVKFYGMIGQPLSIVMEFVDGRNLYDIVHGDAKGLTWGMVKQIAQETAAGIEHLHTKEIVHRDLKSLNLLVTREGTHVKVCDFGLSRVSHAVVKLTGGRGTVHWMAPEVIAHENYGSKADVYSFGIILWEMCAREIPYEDFDDEMKIAEAVLIKQHRPTIPSYVPPDLAKLIRTCWDDNADKRPTPAQIQQYLSRPGVIPKGMESQPVPFAHSAGGR
eukprot:TRINITY_DN6616_c0_g1_i1.p1 TRINITY_DN6616_c0_g1~~TRINITY_DN6616_c0_g1_i1.p1  ORF type:complete len:306 (-),score=51.19 TRINITY_DN6616_c0_g1_i1:41-892(-)